MTVNELASALGVGRTVVYRLLATLEDHRLVRRDGDGRAQLGVAALGLARAVQPLLRSAAMPALRELADSVGATAHLTVADGNEALAIAVVEPTWTDVHVAYRTGSRHSLDRAAAGRAILRSRAGEPGLVTSSGELQPGAYGIAASVNGVPGLEASVGVISLAPLDVAAVGTRVARAAVAVAEALG
jgi:hypothetical protein